MKILSARDSHLTNAEVLSHLVDMRARHTQLHIAHGPVYSLKSGNLETVTKEVKDYLTTLTPCADQKYRSSNGNGNGSGNSSNRTRGRETMTRFMKEMERFHLEKVELLMLINNRPESQAELYLMVEDVEGRLSEEEQDQVLAVVKNCFGGKYREDRGDGEEPEDEEDQEEEQEERAEEGEGYVEGEEDVETEDEEMG